MGSGIIPGRCGDLSKERILVGRAARAASTTAMASRLPAVESPKSTKGGRERTTQVGPQQSTTVGQGKGMWNGATTLREGRESGFGSPRRQSFKPRRNLRRTCVGDGGARSITTPDTFLLCVPPSFRRTHSQCHALHLQQTCFSNAGSRVMRASALYIRHSSG